MNIKYFMHAMAFNILHGRYWFPMFCYLVIKYSMWVYTELWPKHFKTSYINIPVNQQWTMFIKIIGHSFAPPILASSMFLYLIY